MIQKIIIDADEAEKEVHRICLAAPRGSQIRVFGIVCIEQMAELLARKDQSMSVESRWLSLQTDPRIPRSYAVIHHNFDAPGDGTNVIFASPNLRRWDLKGQPRVIYFKLVNGKIGHYTVIVLDKE